MNVSQHKLKLPSTSRSLHLNMIHATINWEFLCQSLSDSLRPSVRNAFVQQLSATWHTRLIQQKTTFAVEELFDIWRVKPVGPPAVPRLPPSEFYVHSWDFVGRDTTVDVGIMWSMQTAQLVNCQCSALTNRRLKTYVHSSNAKSTRKWCKLGLVFAEV